MDSAKFEKGFIVHIVEKKDASKSAKKSAASEILCFILGIDTESEEESYYDDADEYDLDGEYDDWH